MLGVNVTVSIVVGVSLGSVIRTSCSRDGLEWEFVGVLWVLWGGKWGCLSKGSFPWTIVLGISVTISVMISVGLGSVISNSCSGDGLERKLVGVLWVLWSSEWGSLSLSEGSSTFPGSIVLRVSVTISVVISVSLGSIISYSVSRDSLEWKFVGIFWVLRSRNWGSVSLGKGSCPWTIVLRVDVTISIVVSISLWSIISNSCSRNSLEWKLISVLWVLWGSKWSGLFLSKGSIWSSWVISFPGTIVLGVNVTITVVISVGLGSIISYSWSRDGLEWKFISVLWVLRSSKRGGLCKCSCPWTIVLGINITISVVISVSLWSIISYSCSRNSLEWKFIGILWILWSSKWSSFSLGSNLNQWLTNQSR